MRSSVTIAAPYRSPICRPALTLLIAACCYAAWLTLLIFHNAIPIWLLIPLGGYVVCLHGSLQHEAVHGRPTSRGWFNSLLVMPPLSLGYPYQIYREEHLQHHRCEVLTDSIEDPETLYFTAEQWQNKKAFFKWVQKANFTLLGRLTIGPAVATVTLWRNQLRKILQGDPIRAGIWILHLLLSATLILFAYYAVGLPPWKYVLCFAYPGIALTLLRSYTEHRWSDNADERTIIIEGSPITELLYLNNNYHWLHHENPQLPWYFLRREFTQRRGDVMQANGHFYIRSYLHLIPRLWRDKLIPPAHPAAAG